MKNKLYKATLAMITASMLASPLAVYATENDDTVIETVSETEEVSETLETLETDENGVVTGIYADDPAYEEDSVFEAAGRPVEDLMEEMGEGDGLDGDIVDVLNLPSNEINNCQLTLNASLPTGFDANVYVQLKNYDNGKIYQYTLYAVNNYLQRGYIPNGEYRVIECGVYDDINNAFPFNVVDDFTLQIGDVKAITVSLVDEDAAMEEIAKRSDIEAEEKKKDVSEYTETEFEVTHTGESTGQMAVTGAQKAAYEIVAKVTTGGVPGYMKVDISLDDGLTYNLTNVDVPYSGMVSLTGTGLTLVFEVAKTQIGDNIEYGTFNEGDTFRCIIHDPTNGVNYGGKHQGRAKLQLVDENPDISIYDQMIRYNIPIVQIKVVKGGGAGEAVIQYSLDGVKYSDEMIVPADGTWKIENTTLSIQFYSNAGPMYLNKDDTYTAEPYMESQKGFIGILIAIAGIFALGFTAVWFYFKKQIISPGVYQIHEYKPIEKEEKKKPAKKQKKAEKADE